MTDMSGETGKADAPKRKRAPRKRKVADVNNDTQSVQAESVSHDDQVTQATDVSDDNKPSTYDILKLGNAIHAREKKKPTRLTLNVDDTTYRRFRMMAVLLDVEHGALFRRAVDCLEQDVARELQSGGDDDNASSG